MPPSAYRVYAIRYASLERRSPDNFIGGDEHDTDMPLAYYVWAIVGGGRTLVVDTGFDRDVGARRGREMLHPVEAGLLALDIAPDTVRDVIITHMHYDHAGNHALLPHARFHLQDSEMAFATGRCMCHRMLRGAYEADDVARMVQRVFADRVQFHDGAGEVAPGVEVHHIGGHTRGLQVVRVFTERGWVVLASDASHFYAHMDEGRVFPIVYQIDALLEGYATLRRLASSPAHIVPGHDPLVLQRYPAARPGTEGWIVRLDVDPVS
ncbi:N-acyl homoserine lactonase family protein [Paraburkholderia acidipaludis]|uniref:N-acyl homoserine lactonase family protein n=1 Tax=Paraburkholderia acidipaludis TaxID=660537 RepID=UPI000481002E|nr:N-acyl homoserine lactonase family protein [Paraburkholderia acidipaludis]